MTATFTFGTQGDVGTITSAQVGNVFWNMANGSPTMRTALQALNSTGSPVSVTIRVIDDNVNTVVIFNSYRT
jgi:hypothetical protein